MWDVTDTEVKTLCTLTISTHTSRVGCDIMIYLPIKYEKISTHTSRVGCDNICIFFFPVCYISTHTSRVGCDNMTAGEFQVDSNFYSHIPCGMWRCWLLFYALGRNFYSHIPCGMWQYDCGWISGRFEFLLTHPVWDVTHLVHIW